MNLDNHDGEITHLEPDILECKVKWTLGSIILNKAMREFHEKLQMEKRERNKDWFQGFEPQRKDQITQA